MSKIKLNNNSTRLSLFVVVLLVGGLFIAINSAQQNQEQRGKAAGAPTSSVQAQCSSSGKVELAFSFTNPETYAIDLTAEYTDPAVQDSVDKNVNNIAPGATATGIVSTNKSSVTAGNITFLWFPSDINNLANGGEQNKPYTALNCGSSTTPTPTTGSITGSLSPTVGATIIPTTTGSITILPTQSPIVSGKKAATDINDDGLVNQVDYNLFLREISTQPGN